MKIYLRHVKDFGFKGTSMFTDAKYSTSYYASIPKRKRVIGVTNLFPQMIYYFDLTPKQYSDFEKGKLSLIPPGCCNPCGGAELEDATIYFQDDIKNKQELDFLLKRIM